MRLNTFFNTMALTIALLSPAFAHLNVGNLELDNYWVRPGTVSKNTAAYLTINNPVLTKDKLLKVTCDVCKVTELHNHLTEAGVMKMRPVDFIEINSSKIELKPGSLHIMLMDLKRDLKEGETIKLHLIFEKAGAIDVDFTVGNPVEKTASHH